jgi:RNA polymerase sigma factor (sigma-70 family)
VAARHPPFDRHDRVGAAFAAHAERVHHMVASRTRPEFRHLADDACAFAWCRLVDRIDIQIDDRERYVGWVYTVARNEHLALIRRDHGHFSLDSWAVESRDAPLEQLPGLGEPHVIAEQREQLALLDEVPPERREALLLQAAGHSYAEIGDLMGLTPRQVTRYLSEGTRRVRELDRERSRVPRGPPDSERLRGAISPRNDLDPSTTHGLELDLDL